MNKSQWGILTSVCTCLRSYNYRAGIYGRTVIDLRRYQTLVEPFVYHRGLTVVISRWQMSFSNGSTFRVIHDSTRTKGTLLGTDHP